MIAKEFDTSQKKKMIQHPKVLFVHNHLNIIQILLKYFLNNLNNNNILIMHIFLTSDEYTVQHILHTYIYFFFFLN